MTPDLLWLQTVLSLLHKIIQTCIEDYIDDFKTGLVTIDYVVCFPTFKGYFQFPFKLRQNTVIPKLTNALFYSSWLCCVVLLLWSLHCCQRSKIFVAVLNHKTPLAQKDKYFKISFKIFLNEQQCVVSI